MDSLLVIMSEVPESGVPGVVVVIVLIVESVVVIIGGSM